MTLNEWLEQSKSFTDEYVGDSAKDLKEEYTVLCERMARFNVMLYFWDKGILSRKPESSRELLQEQLEVMAKYKSILERRSKEEGVELCTLIPDHAHSYLRLPAADAVHAGHTDGIETAVLSIPLK